MEENIEEKLKNGTYRIFSKDTPHEQAIAKFVTLFGFQPELCVLYKNLIYVGPIKKDKP